MGGRAKLRLKTKNRRRGKFGGEKAVGKWKRGKVRIEEEWQEGGGKGSRIRRKAPNSPPVAAFLFFFPPTSPALKLLLLTFAHLFLPLSQYFVIFILLLFFLSLSLLKWQHPTISTLIYLFIFLQVFAKLSVKLCCTNSVSDSFFFLLFLSF